MTPYHSLYRALLLTLRETPGTIGSLSRSIASARVDLNVLVSTELMVPPRRFWIITLLVSQHRDEVAYR
jgi:hypothetical protein